METVYYHFMSTGSSNAKFDLGKIYWDRKFLGSLWVGVRVGVRVSHKLALKIPSTEL